MADRRRGLAAVGLLDAGADAVFRRHLLAAAPPRRMPGFDEVLAAVAAAWAKHRGEVRQQAQRVVEALAGRSLAGRRRRARVRRPLEAAEKALTAAFDPPAGGFSPAPKFPQPDEPVPPPAALAANRPSRPCWTWSTPRSSAWPAGGIYDQLGGGFHRYSVDAQWLVPHFEKMLYDNALLAACYTEAWQATGNPLYQRVVRETLDYVLRDMTLPEGGFAAAEDADSEGVEGKFYLWTPDEVAAVLGAGRGQNLLPMSTTSPTTGNFEGRNILHLATPLEACGQDARAGDGRRTGGQLAEDRRRLLAARARTRAARAATTRCLLGWNGLMIDALARAGAALGEPRYGAAAARAADFLLDALRDAARPVASTPGAAAGPATPPSWTIMPAWPTPWQRSTNRQPQRRWLDEAVRLADLMLAHFADPRRAVSSTPPPTRSR